MKEPGVDDSLVSNEDFATAMRPVASALNAYAIEVNSQEESNGSVPAAASKAMGELSIEWQWATTDWLEPARNAHSYGSALVYSLVEHVAAYAAIIGHTSVGPAFGHRPSVRAVFEIAPIAHWLLDPSIGAETRIQRSIAYRLNSANQVGRMKHLEQAVEDSMRSRAACSDYAKENGWVIEGNAVGGQAVPNPSEAFSPAVYGRSALHFDRTMWSLLSASIHGTWYALSDGLFEKIVEDPLDPNGGFAPIVIEAKQIIVFAITVAEGLRAGAEARASLLGWETTDAIVEAWSHITNLSKVFLSGMQNT